jgi:hypothetical protein
LSEVKDALETLNSFITLSKEISKLPALILPQYQSAAKDLFQICQKILTANEKLTGYLHQFRDLDLRRPDAREKTSDIIREYKAMKISGLNNLKFSCHDIGIIYSNNIKQKIGKWFSNQQKLEESQGIFEKLTQADTEMITFIVETVIKKIDEFANEIDGWSDQDLIHKAEASRIKFKTQTSQIAQNLEKFNNDLAELVMRFSEIAKTPITIGP